MSSDPNKTILELAIAAKVLAVAVIDNDPDCLELANKIKQLSSFPVFDQLKPNDTLSDPIAAIDAITRLSATGADENTLKLIAGMLGIGPCPICGYIHTNCQCEKPATL